MDAKYALEIMKRELNNKYISSEIKQAFEVSIEALKKQIPKAITGAKSRVKALDVETKKVLTYECSPCPNCEAWISKVYKYCPHCGQRVEE